MSGNKLVTFAACIEAATGIALAVAPLFVAELLLGETVSGVTLPISRVAGFGMFALAIAVWPERSDSCARGHALLGLLAYNGLASMYLLYLALRDEWVGPLLWPVVALHVVVTTLLARAWFIAPGATRSSAA